MTRETFRSLRDWARITKGIKPGVATRQVFVSQEGNDANYGFTKDRPLRTLQEAVSRLGRQPGTIWLRCGGEYGTLSNSTRG